MKLKTIIKIYLSLLKTFPSTNMIKITSTLAILASSLALIESAKVTIINNCKEEKWLWSYAKRGTFDPFPEGKKFPVGHREIIDFGDEFWAGDFGTIDLKTVAWVAANLEK